MLVIDCPGALGRLEPSLSRLEMNAPWPLAVHAAVAVAYDEDWALALGLSADMAAPVYDREEPTFDGSSWQ